MAVEIGINPITWTNDDMPELGGDIPLETCLAETREAGYGGTELGGKFPRASGRAAPILARHRLKLVSGWYDGRIFEREVAAEFAAIEPHLTLLRDLGCKVMSSMPIPRAGATAVASRRSRSARRSADGDWPAYGRKVTALAERMAAFGVRMAFHHHMGTIVESDADIGRLMAAHRRGGRAAVRHRPLPVRRRRSCRAARTPHRARRACALQGCRDALCSIARWQRT